MRRDEAWARIQREKVLRVGMDASFPPFEVVDGEGRFSGLDVDLATELARRWGASAQFINVGLDGLYDALKLGKFDLIISALPYDRTQTRDVLYSPSYFNAGQVLLARREDTRLRSFEDLEGGKVAVELGTEAHQLVRRLARDKGMHVQVLTQREPTEAAELVRHGGADALVCDRVTAYAHLRTGDLRLVGTLLTDEPYVIAARVDSPLLMAGVSRAIEEWQANGFLDALLRRWF
jgi:polar amino acid transport system substrate-binding protein